MFNTVSRPRNEQALRSNIQIAASMNGNASWISIA
jgi:hypothetical protein